VIFDQVDHLPKDSYSAFIEKKEDWPDLGGWKPPDLPVATAPIWGHPRALRQHGFFTIHGNRTEPLEEQVKDSDEEIVKKIEIRKEMWQPLKLLLKEAGVDHYSVFPDLEGLVRKLRRWYGWV
jgi:hypothetical protein